MENTEKEVISIYKIVGQHFCALTGQGNLVFEKISECLEKDKPVVLNFNEVTQATPTFLNAAVGQLYSKFSETKIKKLVSVEEIDAYEVALLIKVVNNAKRYFREKEKNVK